MNSADGLRSADAAVVARYLQIRGIFHDQVLAPLEQVVPLRHEVTLTRRIGPTLQAQVRSGYVRPTEGEIWPVIFFTTVDIHVALCFQITRERLANLGTLVNGPVRIRHRSWDDWWGWEAKLGDLHPTFLDLEPAEQHEVLVQWFLDQMEWLVHIGLLRRRTQP